MSLSGYLTNRMEEMMIKEEVFAKHSPFMEKIAVDQNRVIKIINKIGFFYIRSLQNG